MIYQNKNFNLRRISQSEIRNSAAAEKSESENEGGQSSRPEKSLSFDWSGWRDLNPRPPRPERGALPSCATPRIIKT